MADSMFLAAVLTVLIALAFFAISHYLKRYRQRVDSYSLSSSHAEEQEEDDENKRQLDRINLQWPVILEADGKRIEALTTNISICGAFVVHPNPLKAGERFNIIFDIPEHEKITLEGQVVWNNMSLPADKVVNRGMGIRFLWISKDSRENLNTILLASKAGGS